MTLTLGADVIILNMLPIFLRASDPIVTIAIIASFTNRATAVFTEVIRQLSPGLTIKIAIGAFVMGGRVSSVLTKGATSLEQSVATVAPATSRLVTT